MVDWVKLASGGIVDSSGDVDLERGAKNIGSMGLVGSYEAGQEASGGKLGKILDPGGITRDAQQVEETEEQRKAREQASQYGQGAVWAAGATTAGEDKAQEQLANSIAGSGALREEIQGQEAFTAGRTELGPAAQMTGATVNAPEAAQAETIARTQIDAPLQYGGATAQRVSGPTAARVGAVAGPQAGLVQALQGPQAAQIAALQGPQAAQLNGPGVDARQENLANALAAQAQGQGPSLSRSLMQQAQEDNLSQQMSLLASSRGRGNAGLAARQAADAASAGNARIARDMGIQAMREQQGAQQQLGGLLSQTRAQDIGLATTQAQFNQQAGLAGHATEADRQMQQAQLEQQARLQGFSAEQARAHANAQMQSQASLARYQGQLSQAEQQAQMEQQAGLAGYQGEIAQRQAAADRQQQAGLQSAQLRTDIALQQGQMDSAAAIRGAELGTSVNLANYQGGLETALAQAGFDQGASQFNAGQLNEFGLTQGQMDQQREIFNAGAQADQTLAGQQLQAGLLGQEAQWGVAGAELGLARDQMLQSALLGAGGLEAGIYNTQFGGALTNAQLAQQQQQGILGAAGGVAAAFSDERLKTNISDGSEATENLLNALQGYEYEYKEPQKPGRFEGKMLGPMAQALEKSEIGKTFVHETPEGKLVDFGRMVPALASSLNHVNNKIDRLAEALKKKN